MTGNKSFLTDHQKIDGGFVAFRGSPKGGKITGKDHLGKFEGKADEGFLVGYSVNRKAFKVFRNKKDDRGIVIRNKARLVARDYTQEKGIDYDEVFALVARIEAIRSPNLDFMRPFGCHVTILNTLDHLGKFEGKADEGFLVGYSVNRKAFKVFNTRTKKVEENLHIKFLENKSNVVGSVPE
nr:retrovirus-related Pol polyprotein from transposon TNT 1-94 [Tanacetum cinerariifolium]